MCSFLQKFVCCASDESLVAAEINKQIEREIKKQKRDARKELKLLLLGTGESGKSTFIKQMKIIHGNGFSDDDKKHGLKYIYQNIFTSVQNLIKAMHQLQIEYERAENIEAARLLSEISVRDISTHSAFYPSVNRIGTFWRDNGVRACYERRREFQLSDSTHFFLSQLDRISRIDYFPTDEDMLRVRVPTTGILETRNSEQNAPEAYLSLENETPVELPIPPKKDTKENIRAVKTPKRKRLNDEPSTSSAPPVEDQPSTSATLPPEDMDYEESNDGLDQIEVVSVEALTPAEAMEMSFDDPPSSSDDGVPPPSSTGDGPGDTTVQKIPNDAMQTNSVDRAPEEVQNSSQDSTPDEVVSALDTFFRNVYKDFKSNDEEWQRRWTLIPEFAQECIEKINTCHPSAVDEVLRWYARSQGWRARLKKSFDDDFKVLVNKGIIKQFCEKVDIKFEEVLDIMSKDEMTKFAQRQLVGKAGSMDAMKAKLLASFKEGMRVNPVTKKRRADFLLLSAKRAVEGRYQLSQAHSESLNIFFLLHSPSLVQHRIEDATSVAQGIIQSISRFGMKAPLPDTIKITSPRHEAHVALPHYHFRLTTTGVFAKISYFRVEILEKRKKFQEAADAIKQILSAMDKTHLESAACERKARSDNRGLGDSVEGYIPE
ncbi:Oidioi.mRNA.OKI2018_I69.XSR.g16028.t2.cds [Oikopleura dioica]|uniref:Oidioi.mRNA.OKI2018_I69.XSR.g16028.t2.cds n=1 Tax=Oikopleura dioica TaxID=34765 RepID=A0ABN7SEQ7_OIKDI|nr:Oidioi.mRNA.OKI2018_I69.XSR.g16028.t2.cds [Oikopleura dioica]